MYLKDLQLVRYLIADSPQNGLINNALHKKIDVVFDRTSSNHDKADCQSDGVVIINPTSVVKFLFSCLYQCLSDVFIHDIEKDELSLSLYYFCTNYVYEDYNDAIAEHDLPSALMSYDKFAVPSNICRNIIEPLIGRIDKCKVLYAKFIAIDSCSYIAGKNELDSLGLNQFRTLNHRDFPILLCNSSIHNKASHDSGLLWGLLSNTIGEKKARAILHEMFHNVELLEKMIIILRAFNGDSDYIINFLRFLQSQCTIVDTFEQVADLDKKCCKIIESVCNISLSKQASDSDYTPQVFRQWTEWSMLKGLIEKQLGGTRGSAWPTTEQLGPFEKDRKKMFEEKAKEKNKKQLNYEELLEAARDIFMHKAVQPGQVYEVMLRNNRVWK